MALISASALESEKYTDRDRFGRLPTQMTTEFLPQNQAQKKCRDCRGLVVKEIHSICQLKELRARNALTSRTSNASGVGALASEWAKTKQKQESPSTTENLYFPCRNLTQSICSAELHFTAEVRTGT